MLSKAKGEILQVAACIHVLFADDDKKEIFIPEAKQTPSVISDSAIIAAEDFVKTCCQHCLYLCGEGSIENEIRRCSGGMDSTEITLYM